MAREETMTKHLYNLRTDKVIPIDAVRIDRRTPWGNPFIIDIHGNREECVNLYISWLAGGVKAPGLDSEERRAWIIKNIGTLANKSLICWCSPEACHGDFLHSIAVTARNMKGDENAGT